MKKTHLLIFKTENGETYVSITKRSDGKYNFQFDSCVSVLSKKNLEDIISEIKSTMKEWVIWYG